MIFSISITTTTESLIWSARNTAIKTVCFKLRGMAKILLFWGAEGAGYKLSPHTFELHSNSQSASTSLNYLYVSHFCCLTEQEHTLKKNEIFYTIFCWYIRMPHKKCPEL